MGMCKCIKCGNHFDSRDDMGDTLYPGYKGNSWACHSCHEKEHDKKEDPSDPDFIDTVNVRIAINKWAHKIHGAQGGYHLQSYDECERLVSDIIFDVFVK